MQINRSVENLFPTPVTIVNVDDFDFTAYAEHAVNALSEDELQNMHTRGIGTTPDDLHTRPEFKGLVDLIHNEAMLFFADVLGLGEEDLVMTTMWSNTQLSRARHHVHQHPNSFYSGVIYLEVPETEGDDPGWLFFIDPRPAKNMWSADYNKQNQLSERSYGFEPKTGTLLFFPSWLEHGTEVCVLKENEKRISLSFNYALKKCSSHTMKLNFS
jgi:uncharacterized protein (TIGR02466 family)